MLYFKKNKSVFNKEFLSQLRDLVAIVIPSWRSKQVGPLILWLHYVLTNICRLCYLHSSQPLLLLAHSSACIKPQLICCVCVLFVSLHIFTNYDYFFMCMCMCIYVVFTVFGVACVSYVVLSYFSPHLLSCFL